MSKPFAVYIASSWKNQHAVEMLTAHLREMGCVVLSFVENNHGENPNSSIDEWCQSPDGTRSFNYDTKGATESNLVIYIGPSGTDAWAEVGAAWGRGVPVIGLWAKGEQAGLMRRMVEWFTDYRALLVFLADYLKDRLHQTCECAECVMPALKGQRFCGGDYCDDSNHA
jgi:hypothetical protein